MKYLIILSLLILAGCSDPDGGSPLEVPDVDTGSGNGFGFISSPEGGNQFTSEQLFDFIESDDLNFSVYDSSPESQNVGFGEITIDEETFIFDYVYCVEYEFVFDNELYVYDFVVAANKPVTFGEQLDKKSLTTLSLQYNSNSFSQSYLNLDIYNSKGDIDFQYRTEYVDLNYSNEIFNLNYNLIKRWDCHFDQYERYDCSSSSYNHKGTGKLKCGADLEIKLN